LIDLAGTNKVAAAPGGVSAGEVLIDLAGTNKAKGAKG
jgi:hypothetical protein